MKSTVLRMRPQFVLGLAVRGKELGACIVCCETGTEVAACTLDSRRALVAWMSEEFVKYRSLCIVTDASTCPCHGHDQPRQHMFVVNDRPRFVSDVYSVVMREASAANHLPLREAVAFAAGIVQAYDDKREPAEDTRTEAKRVAMLTVRCMQFIRLGTQE